jgi:gliding motility-associated-like protein
MDISVTAQKVPTFTQIGPLGRNSAAPALPLISINGITGTWNPVAILTSTAGQTTYTFTPDAGQCASNTHMEVIITNLTCPLVNLGKDIVACSTNPITLKGDDGTGDSYQWSRLEGSVQVPIGKTSTIVADKTANYILAVTKNGCTVSDTVYIKILDFQLFGIDSVRKKDNTCFGEEKGSIEIFLHGTGASYQYSIDKGETNQASRLFENLGTGIYNVRVSEDSTCSFNYAVPVTIGPKDTIKISYQLKPPGCKTCNDGILMLDVTGGWGGYRITLSGRPIELVTGSLGVGNYTIEVTDAKGCLKTVDFVLDEINMIPNVITTNGDGINELWKLPMLKYFPDAIVKVYTVTGKLVFESAKGYPVPWDGRDNGNPLPMGTYYYLIYTSPGERPLTGYLTILR